MTDLIIGNYIEYTETHRTMLLETVCNMLLRYAEEAKSEYKFLNLAFKCIDQLLPCCEDKSIQVEVRTMRNTYECAMCLTLTVPSVCYCRDIAPSDFCAMVSMVPWSTSFTLARNRSNSAQISFRVDLELPNSTAITCDLWQHRSSNISVRAGERMKNAEVF